MENRLFLQLRKVPIPQSPFLDNTIDNRIFNYLWYLQVTIFETKIRL